MTLSRIVVFRVDGSQKLGMGHVMRCLALARNMRQHQKRCVFVVKNLSSQITKIIQGYGMVIELLPGEMNLKDDAAATVAVAQKIKAEVIITDLANSWVVKRYKQMPQYVQALKGGGCWVVGFDGLDADSLAAKVALDYDVLVMPYSDAKMYMYKKSPGTKFLLGLKYFVLAPELMDAAKKRKSVNKQVKTILVTLGGGNVAEKTRSALSILRKTKLEAEIKAIGTNNRRVSAKKMSKLLSWADLVITGKGLTKYEAAALGCPVIIASKQLQQNVIQLAGNWPARKKLSAHGKRLVDGFGMKRLLQYLKQ